MKHLHLAETVVCAFFLASLRVAAAENAINKLSCNETINITDTVTLELPTYCTNLKWSIVPQGNYPKPTSLRAFFTSRQFSTLEEFIVLTDSNSRNWIFNQLTDLQGNTYFVTDGNFTLSALMNQGSTFKLTVTLQKFGGNLKAKDILVFTPDEPKWQLSTSTYWTVSVEQTNQAILVWNLLKTKLSENSEVLIYEGHTEVPDFLLGKFTHASPVFQVFSQSTKMLVVAKNFDPTSCLQADVRQLPSGTNVKSSGTSGLFSVSAPIDKETRTWIVDQQTSVILSLNINQAGINGGSQVHFYKSSSGYEVAPFLSLNSSLLSARTLLLYINHGLRVDYVSETSIKSPQILFSASYDVVEDCGAMYNNTDKSRVLTSAGYPNVYPFGTICNWTLVENVKSQVHIQFEDLDLEDDHTLTIKTVDKFTDSFSQTYQGKKLPADLIFQATNVEFTLDTSKFSYFDDVARKGFKLMADIYACGENFTLSTYSFVIPTILKEKKNYSCLWRIEVPRAKGQLNNINIKIKSSSPQANGSEIKIYDGDRLGDSALHLNFVDGSAAVATKSNHIFLTYLYDIETKDTANYTFSYEPHECNDAMRQCDNGDYCLQDKWKCNGVNDCGDWSDEKDCLALKDCGTILVNGSLTFTDNSDTPLECSWLFKANTGSILVAHVLDVSLDHPLDSLTFMDATNLSNPILVINQLNRMDSATIIVTDTSSLWVSYLSFNNGSSLKLDLHSHKGGSLYSAGKINITSLGNDDAAFFALKANDVNYQVLIQDFTWMRSIPSAEVNFYEGFSNKTLLATFNNTDIPYNVFSMSDKMLVVARNFRAASASMSFVSAPTGSHVLNTGDSGSFHVAAPVDKSEIRSWLLDLNNKNVTITLSQLSLNSGSQLNFYNGLSYSMSRQPLLTISNNLTSSRALSLSIESGLRVDYVSQSSIKSKETFLSAYYDATPGCGYEKNLMDGQSFVVSSPGYPNVYPYGSTCQWTIVTQSEKLIYMSFTDVDLDDHHTLTVQDHTFNGSESLTDLVFRASKVQLALNATDLTKFTDSPHRGFVVSITVYAVGQNSESHASNFSIPGCSRNDVQGLWSIGSAQGKNKVSNIHITIDSTDKNAKGTELTLFDGPNKEESAKVLDLTFINGTAGLLTNHSRLFIVYDAQKRSTDNTNYTVSYSIQECDVSHQCDNHKMCMHEAWRCSGVNDCGDGSDERDCFNHTDYPKKIVKNMYTLTPTASSELTPHEANWQFEASSAKNILVASLLDLDLRHPMDSLIFRDGSVTSDPLLVITRQNYNLKDSLIVTSRRSSLSVSFFSFSPQNGSTWTLNITEKSGGGFYSSGNVLNVTKSINGKTFFALQAKSMTHQVQIQNFTWATRPLPSPEVLFYDGFSTTNRALLAKFTSETREFNVFSMTDKMLIVADHFEDDTTATMAFVSIPKGNHIIDQSDSGTLRLPSLDRGETVWIIKPKPNNEANDVIVLALDKIQLLSPASSVVVQEGPEEDARTLISFPSTVNVPQVIHIHAKRGARVTINNIPSTEDVLLDVDNASISLDAHFDVAQPYRVIHHLKHIGQEVKLTSPRYPNLYPLNADCSWDIVHTNFSGLLTFSDLDLHPGHELHIVQFKNGTRISPELTFSENTLPEDIFIDGDEVQMRWSSSLLEGHSRVAGKGFSMTIRALDCGAKLVSKIGGSFQTPGYPKKLDKSSECVWIVSPNVTFVNENVVNFTANQIDFKYLHIHDGGSLRDEIITNKSRSMLSSTDKLLFHFKYVNENTTVEGLAVNYEIQLCKLFCNNSLCMHEDWLCDGINHCGDGTDELNCQVCNSPPTSAPIPSGVSTGWLAGSIIMALIVGAALAFLIPFAYKKWTNRKNEGSYQRFDSSVNAS